MNAYQLKAQATKARRTYSRPTQEQKAAYANLLKRDGEKNLTADDARLLAGHPYMTIGQREKFAALAESR